MKPRFFITAVSSLKNLFYYYYFFLFFILCILAAICSTYFIITKKRFNLLNEIEDYQWFNEWFPDIANGMLYDMSYSQKCKINELPEDFTKLMDSDDFLDIGSGGGEASIFHLQQMFGKDTKIVLSDLHPKPELWDKFISPNIRYIKSPFDATRLYESTFVNNIKQISCFGSFHHMDESTIQKIFDQLQKKDVKMLIVEPRRYPDVIQYLHILTLPIIGLLSYSIISLFGSTIVAKNPLNGILRFLMVPFFMTTDHILGASRRYSLCEIENMGKKSRLQTFHHSDLMFDYYILVPVY
jgi:SAM-dependent methyltransferase